MNAAPAQRGQRLSVVSGAPVVGHRPGGEEAVVTETYRGAVFISTDSHVTEPITLYADGVAAMYRDRVPRIVDRDGWRTLHVEGLDPRKLMRASDLADATIGDVDASSRFTDQERDGVRAEVIFPTFALQACFASDDPALQLELCRAYNGWANEVFGGIHELLAVGMVPMLDIEGAIDEARRLAAAGFRALFLPARVPQRPYNDAEYDRFWAVAQELGLPLTFHSGTGHEPRVVRGPGGAVVNYILGAQLDGPMVMLTMAAGGALDRFPGLQLVTVETGAAWLGWIMTQADAIYEDHSAFAQPKLSLKPSELIRRQAKATFMYDPVAINNRAITGVETLMWGNDYPHPEGAFPYSQEWVEKQFAGVPEAEVERMTFGNAKELFGFDV
jgi:predicted TIM-barrel fold metal-dependent hydrolase